MFTLRLRPFDADLLLTPQWGGPPLLKWGLLLLVCGVPLALVVWLYRYELRLVPRLTALGLLGLRVVALVLILFLACLQPIYARSRTEGLPGRVLIAVDRSDSMDVADPQRPAVDKLRLARALKLGGDLASDAQLAGWITDYEQKRGPQWAGQDEARAAHDRVCELIDKLTRSQAAERVLGEEGVRLLGTLAAKHQVELLGFNRESWDLKPDQLADLFHKAEAPAAPEKKAEGEKKPDPLAGANASAFTDLRLPLVRAQERSGPGQGKVLGVVLLTDGQHNAGDPPNKLARELGQRGLPVYPVALGARKPPPDVAIVSLRCAPSTVFKDVDANLDVRFKVTGLPAGDYVVEVHRAGTEKKLLAQRTVAHDGKDRDYSERFKLRMEEVGTQTLVASVRPADPEVKETRTDNNSRATSVNVADDTAKVLLIDGEARWEFHYLASALKRDRTMKLTSVVFEQPRLDDNLTPEDLEKLGSPRQKLPEGRDALGDYQCVVLGDVSPAQLPLAERQRLEKYVADGGTLVVLAGKRSMPLAFPEADAGGDGDPLRKLLPIESPRVIAPAEGFSLTLSQAGRETSFMEFDPDTTKSAERWAAMPPHYWGVVGRAKPGATTLAWVEEAGAANKAGPERERASALIARHNYGFGRVLYVGIDSTWRWRFKVGDTYHHRFWGQAIRWAAADKPLVTGNTYVRLGTPQP
ncbi:MAG TPA: vWA domain-containing protein, partial [Gemmataceae bacterium]|nr:vWA domain-containing protein [Gemmataceae bacterium]